MAKRRKLRGPGARDCCGGGGGAAPRRLEPTPKPPCPRRNEDFYAVKAAGRLPEFDVFLTNPPFSGDHLERTFKFAVKCGR